MTAEWEDQVGMPPNDGNDVEKIGPSVPHSLHKTTHIRFSPKPSLTNHHIHAVFWNIYIHTHNVLCERKIKIINFTFIIIN